MKKINLIKLSVILTTAFIFLIGIVAVFLPLLVTLYVEKTGRLEILATTIMITCYPCAPFTVLSLWYLRKVLKNFLAKNYLAPENEKYLKYMAFCCMIISLITVVAGRFYLPFFLVAATFLFLSLLIFVFRSILLELKEQ
ncbi:MAG: hypothetical protein UHM16_03415 [Acutalibacteraceae bacterium]|nr:hypothetical protein [Acutalibacteraceae bacterium]